MSDDEFEYEREDEFVDDRDDYGEEDEDDLADYKTPTDEDLEALGINHEDEYEAEDDSRIDMGAEWRDFADGGASKSRVGMARAIDIDEDLGTMIVDERFKKMERMARTPEDIFRALAMDTATKYNLSKENYDDAIRVMQLINKHNKRLKYKSPRAIMFALLVFTNTTIDRAKLDKIYNDKAKHENMTKMDLLRYAIFIQTLRKL